MMTKKIDKKRDQMMIFCMDDMVPQDHLLRLIDRAIDWNFIYDLRAGIFLPAFLSIYVYFISRRIACTISEEFFDKFNHLLS